MRLYRWIWVVVLGLGSLVASPASGGDKGVSRFELDNGLQVWLRPVRGSAETSVVVLFDIGEDHDPEGQSGLAHLVEHCYVTAAAGEFPARTVDDIKKAYRRGWNAQTGPRYTAIATTFPNERLDDEIREAAARMGALRIEDGDLEREVPRLLGELSRMFDRFPALVGRNRARERICPSPRRGRKGGVPADVERLGPDDLQERHARFYKPHNASLGLAGDFDPEKARALVREHFGGIPPGEKPPEPGAPAKPRLGPIERHPAQGMPPDPPGHLSVAYRAPAPADPSFTPFVLLVGRLFGAQNSESLPDGIKVEWAPLDDPHVLFLSGPQNRGETAEAAEQRIRGVIEKIAAKPPGLGDRMLARQLFSRLLATIPVLEATHQGRTYPLAFGLIRRDQMGIDGAALGKGLLDTEEAAFRSMANALFANKDASAAVVVVSAR